VADNFQNGYKESGRWLVAQNETRSIQMMGARQIGYFANELSIDRYEETLTDMGISEDRAQSLREGFQAKDYPFIEFSTDPQENKEMSIEWVDNLEEISGKQIRYGAVDNRMLPIDDPNTPRIERPSIFYAPVTLAEEDPDDFVETQTVDMDSGEELTEEEFRSVTPDSWHDVFRISGSETGYDPSLGLSLKAGEGDERRINIDIYGKGPNYGAATVLDRPYGPSQR